MRTVRDALHLAAERLALREDLRDQATLDARQLLEIATGLTRIAMLAAPGRSLSPDETARFEALLTQRMQAVPIQYLRGSQEFYGRSFAVSPAVLIPRPETEGIVDAVFHRFQDRHWPLRLADVGTGSGVLAVTLALEYPESTVTALDLSPAALQVAEASAAALGLNRRLLNGTIRFVQSDLLAAVHDQRFDCIVSNPPYVPQTDVTTLHAQVRDHEPHLALFGGPDGHDVLRRLVPAAWDHLVPGGWLLLETAGRTAMLDELLSRWNGVDFLRDLQGIERIAVAQR